MTEKHTALPWKLSNTAFDREFRTFLVNEELEQVVETKGDTMEEAIGNAMLILRAASSHHKLLEACEEALRIMKTSPVYRYDTTQLEQAIAEATKEVERS